jgi:glycosyltransferase involved in cell wall biosynthesis
VAHIAIDARVINSSTGTYVERLLHYLQKIDSTNKYTILVRKKDQDFWKPTADNFTVKVADFDNYSFAEQIGFKRFLDKLHPDLVHFCMPQQPILYKGLHVTTIHDLTLLRTYNTDKNWLVFHLKQLVGRFVFKHVIKSSRYIITISKFSKKEILKFGKIPAAEVAVTPLAADIFHDKLEPYEHPFKEFILYVGQQSDYKNIRRLGDAHQQLLKTHPNLGLILVGRVNASAKITQKYFDSKGYKNILFTDFLPDTQRDWLYKKAAAYIFPSFMEGFGLPGLEAMGYGAPVVSSNATCLPEVYGNAAIYFNPGDTNDMAQAIDKVISDDKLRSELIKKGYKQLAKYSWLRTAKQTHSVYVDALRNYIIY